MIFKSFVTKANKKGTGFIRLPKDKRTLFKYGDFFKITISMRDNKKILFCAHIHKCGVLGIYVPKEIMKSNDFSRECLISFEKADGFYSKIGSDGRVYLPVKMAEELSLKQDDIISIECDIDNKIIHFYDNIKMRKKRTTTEHMIIIDSYLKGKHAVFKIKKVLDDMGYNPSINKELQSVIGHFNYAFINPKQVILFHGHRIPLIINSEINLNELAHYLGAYFADGTKKGNSWGIVASTFEQARYYLHMHSQIVSNPKITFSITATVYNKMMAEHRTYLLDAWKTNAGISVENHKVRLISSHSPESTNRNEFGALVMKDSGQLTLLLYVNLLNKLIEKIVRTKDRMLATQFINGVLEGDGYSSAKGRGHLGITTNKKEALILNEIMPFTGLNFNYRIEGGNRASIILHSTSLLTNILRLKDDIFKYYPKRRKRFIERFLNTGSAKFLIGKQDYASGWVKAHLVKEGILDEDYNLTKKGKNIRKSLMELTKNVAVK